MTISDIRELFGFAITKCSGGYDGDYLDDIVEFSPSTGKWSLLGNMMKTRGYHAVSVVSSDNFQQFCN